MNIDRRPTVLVNVTNANWNSSYKPQYNPWGYSNSFREKGVQGIIDRLDEMIALGYRRVGVMKPIGTALGDDVAAAANAMHPDFKAQWQSVYLPWLASRKAQYPDLLCGFYTGSAFEDLNKIDCDPTSPNLKIATDTSTPQAEANFHGCHDFLLVTLKADFLILDKGSYKDRIDQSAATSNKISQKIITEAIRPDYKNQLAMMARTTYWFKINIPGFGPDSTFDPATTEISWWLQEDFDVPADGTPELLAYCKKIVNQGIVLMCQYPFGAKEIIEASKPTIPQQKTWWHNNFILDKV